MVKVELPPRKGDLDVLVQRGSDQVLIRVARFLASAAIRSVGTVHVAAAQSQVHLLLSVTSPAAAKKKPDTTSIAGSSVGARVASTESPARNAG